MLHRAGYHTGRGRWAFLVGAAWTLIGVGCASTQTLFAAQAVRAACAPTSESSKIEFQVVDQMGGVLPGVRVTLQPASTPKRVRHTNGKGRISIDAPQAGRYDARLELSGFRSVKVEGIMVASSCRVELLVAMKISASEEVVQ